MKPDDIIKSTKLETELDDKIIRLKIKVYCGNDSCSSRTYKINLADILLLIGSSYKCPYCRDYKFLLIKDETR